MDKWDRYASKYALPTVKLTPKNIYKFASVGVYGIKP